MLFPVTLAELSEPFVFMSVVRRPVSIKLTRGTGRVWELSAEQPPVKLT